MKTVNVCGDVLTPDQIDLTKGKVIPNFRMRKKVIERPLDYITKFVYEDEDFEDVNLYIVDEKKQSDGPTQLDIIEAQVTYTAMMTDTLLED